MCGRTRSPLLGPERPFCEAVQGRPQSDGDKVAMGHLPRKAVGEEQISLRKRQCLLQVRWTGGPLKPFGACMILSQAPEDAEHGTSVLDVFTPEYWFCFARLTPC